MKGFVVQMYQLQRLLQFHDLITIMTEVYDGPKGTSENFKDKIIDKKAAFPSKHFTI